MFHWTDATAGLIVAGAFKVFIMLADSMPPPPANCGYWTRWTYDFIQRAASNGEKVGRTQGNVPAPQKVP